MVDLWPLGPPPLDLPMLFSFIIKLVANPCVARKTIMYEDVNYSFSLPL